jgi:hypothetical protein
MKVIPFSEFIWDKPVPGKNAVVPLTIVWRLGWRACFGVRNACPPCVVGCYLCPSMQHSTNLFQHAVVRRHVWVLANARLC